MFTNVLSSCCRRAVIVVLCVLSLTALMRAQTVPTIVWPNPDPISVGTPLGPTQLNASASANGGPVEGTFNYLPPAGTQLPVGQHTLTVTFTPSSAIFLQASAQVLITV